ncbi:MAG: tyrosine-type recombinase/integrase, partial [Terriglobia bacterium]|nr:tyrosine-type recombinase/integrase [Terriglobia bacterium]
LCCRPALLLLEDLRAVRCSELLQLHIKGLSGGRKASWGHIGKYAIEIKTGKSRGKRRAVAVLTQELRNLLEEIPKVATTILTSSKKRPWTADGFGSSFYKAREDAGLRKSNLHFHDLRGTAATFFYIKGISPREIADMLGWSEDRVEKILDRYVRRDAILMERIRKLEAVESAVAENGQ